MTALVFSATRDRKGAVIVLWPSSILLCAVRTIARNPDWQDDQSIAAAGAATSPRSFRAHRLLAASLYYRDPVAQSRRCRSRSRSRLVHPGTSAAGGASTSRHPPPWATTIGSRATAGADPHAPEGHVWYEKSIAVLQRGDGRLASHPEKVRRRADRPRQATAAPRRASRTCTPISAKRRQALGRHDEALARLSTRGKSIPRTAGIYDELATLYATRGNLEAAVILLNQKALLFGVQPRHPDFPSQCLWPPARMEPAPLPPAAPG